MLDLQWDHSISTLYSQVDTEDTTITTKEDTEEVATITKIDEIILAATLISVDATEEIQIGGLHLIMILKSPLQVSKDTGCPLYAKYHLNTYKNLTS